VSICTGRGWAQAAGHHRHGSAATAGVCRMRRSPGARSDPGRLISFIVNPSLASARESEAIPAPPSPTPSARLRHLLFQGAEQAAVSRRRLHSANSSIRGEQRKPVPSSPAQRLQADVGRREVHRAAKASISHGIAKRSSRLPTLWRRASSVAASSPRAAALLDRNLANIAR